MVALLLAIAVSDAEAGWWFNDDFSLVAAIGLMASGFTIAMAELAPVIPAFGVATAPISWPLVGTACVLALAGMAVGIIGSESASEASPAVQVKAAGANTLSPVTFIADTSDPGMPEYQATIHPDQACDDKEAVAIDGWIDPGEQVDSLIITPRGSSGTETRLPDLDKWNLDAGGDATRPVFDPDDGSGTLLGASRVRLHGAPLAGAQVKALIQRMTEHDRQGTHGPRCEYAEISINHVLQSKGLRNAANDEATSQTPNQSGMLQGQHLWDLAKTVSLTLLAARQEGSDADAGGARLGVGQQIGIYAVPQDSPKLAETALWSRLLRAVHQQQPSTPLEMSTSEVPGMRNLLADAQH